MASDQSSSSGRGGSGKTSRRGKRKPVTIDLTAKDVTTEADPKSGAVPETEADPQADKSAQKGATKQPAAAKVDDGDVNKADAEAPGPESDASIAAQADSSDETAGAASVDRSADLSDTSKEAAETGAESSGSSESKGEVETVKAEPGEPVNEARDKSREDKNSKGKASGATKPGEASDLQPESGPEPESGLEPEASLEPEAGPEPEADQKPEADEKPVPAAVATVKPVKTGIGMFGLIAASIFGGVVVAGALIGLLFSGFLPLATKVDLDEISGRLQDSQAEVSLLEARLDEAEEVAAENARSVTDAGALRDRIVAAEEQVAALAPIGERVDAVSATVAALEKDGAAQADSASTIDERQKTMAARLTSLEERSGTGIRNLNEVVRDLAQTGDRLDRVEALQSDLLDLRKLVETGAAGSDVALESLEESLNGLRTRVDALAKASSTAVTDARLAALEAAGGGVDVIARRLGSLEAEVDTMTTRVDKAVRSISPEAPQIDSAINKAFANLEPRFAAIGSDLGAMVEKLAEIRADAAALRERVEIGEKQLATTDVGVTEKLDVIADDIGKAKDSLGAEIAALASKIDALEVQVNKPGALDRAALALAATRLKDAVDGGRPFAAELAAVKALAGEGVDFSVLDERAEAGMADRDALVADFANLSGPIRAAIAATKPQPEATDDPVDQVLTGLRSLVRIKSLDKDDPDMAKLAALNEAVKANDLKAAVTAWQALPEPARAVSDTWAGDVAARLAIDDLVAKVTDDVVKSLSTEPANSTN